MKETTKQEFFAHIARALGKQQIDEKKPVFDILPEGPQNHMMAEMTSDEILAKFLEECGKVGTRCEMANKDTLLDVLKTVIIDNKEEKGTSVLCPDMDEVENYGIRQMLEDNAAEGFEYQKWDASLGHEEMIAIARHSSIGITFPIMAIANTGTIIQPSDIRSGRGVGLLPLTHIAILKKSDIVPRMTQSMQKLDEMYKADPDNFPRNVVHISGPSNTADIELIRVVGVHGPINITFIILEDQ